MSKELAKEILNSKNRYSVSYTNGKVSIRTLRKILNTICDDAEKLISVYQSSTEDITAKLDAIKKVAENKNLTETRVRFWLNDFELIIRKMAQSIVGENK